MELDKLGRNVSEDMHSFLTEAYKDNYFHDIFDLVKIGGLSVAISKVENIAAEKVLASRWSGKNFSTRIWNNTRLLSGVLKETITTGVHRGLSIPKLTKMIEAKMNAGYTNAIRLVRTEMNFVNNQAHYDSMEAAGVSAYEFIATLDNRTSAPCRSRDGETFLLSEKTVGFNYPPLHPRCRSTVAPFIEGEGRGGTRAAKVDKKSIKIPESMNYKDYEKVYVTKEMSLIATKNSLPTVEKNVNIKNMNEDIEFLRRKRAADGHEIIDKPTYQKLTKSFIKAGGIIIRGEEAAKHLKISGAYASYMTGANIAFIADDATVSDVIEEMYHAKQDKTNMFGKLNYEVLLRREIDAQKYLISVAEKYKIPSEETEVTKQNLKHYEELLVKLEVEDNG